MGVLKTVMKLPNSEVETLVKRMTIRTIKSDDFDQLLKLVGEAFRKEEEISGLSVQRLRRLAKLYSLIEVFLPVLDRFHVDLETILVAVLGNKLIGEIHVSPVRKTIWSLDSAAVDKMYRGHGVYKKLLSASLEYIRRKGGRKAVTSLWTDNVAPVKMTNRLGFRVFVEEILLRLEMDKLPVYESNRLDVSLRKMERTDVKKAYELIRTLNPEKTKAFETTQENIVDSFIGGLRNRITWTYSERWVMEKKDEVVGYVHIAYTPRQQAGEIRSFCVFPSNEASDLVAFQLRKVLNSMRKKEIRKVTTFLNKDWKETIEIFKKSGFKPIASVYEMVKELRN